MKFFLGMFFEHKYLRGRHFDNALSGYLWGLSSIWTRNILGLGPNCKFPANFRSSISNTDNIEFHVDDLNNFQSPGTYFQNFAGNIRIGRGTYIGPNVGIITANHNLTNLEHHTPARDVEIGENCWIGMNSVILPGVILGPRTIVGAGAVVTKSFPEGHCIVVGNPAQAIKSFKQNWTTQ